MTVDSITDTYLESFHRDLVALRRCLGLDDAQDWLDQKTILFNDGIRRIEEEGNLQWSKVTNQDKFQKALAMYILWKCCTKIDAGIYATSAIMYENEFKDEMNTVTPTITGGYEQRGDLGIIYTMR